MNLFCEKRGAEAMSSWIRQSAPAMENHAACLL
jgi:hypothetical protein